MKLRNGMKLPDWVKWVARDENYELWCFTDEPSKEGDVWKTEYGIGYCERLDDVDDTYNDIQWDDEKPTPVNKSLHKGGKTEMKKDIEWLKREIRKELESWQGVEGGIDGDGINEITLLINQLDEPEVTLDRAFEKVAESYLMKKEEIWRHLEWLEARGSKVTYKETEVLSQKLPVIPQFVADYIEKWKYEGLIMHEWFTFDHDNQDEDKVSKWLYNNDDEINKRREFMLIDAIRYGYEVKKEKLYHVVNKENYFMLRKHGGLVDILHVSSSMSRDEYGKDTRFMLTEKEIKDYDERFWAFAQEVTE